MGEVNVWSKKTTKSYHFSDPFQIGMFVMLLVTDGSATFSLSFHPWLAVGHGPWHKTSRKGELLAVLSCGVHGDDDADVVCNCILRQHSLS